MLRRFFLILSAALAFAAPVWAGDAANQILAQVNAARAQKGCQPLAMDARLSKSAYGHARAMAEKNFFSHTGANGSSSKSRAHAEGYRSNFIGENVGMGQASSAEVFSNWMGSKGHRANILDCRFKMCIRDRPWPIRHNSRVVRNKGWLSPGLLSSNQQSCFLTSRLPASTPT